MHSHPHGLTHPDKRGCVVYSRQLCRTAKNLGVLCCPAREVNHCRFLSSMFYHTPLLRHSSSHRGWRKFAQISSVIANAEPTFSFAFVCFNEVFMTFSPCLFVGLQAHAQSLHRAAGRVTTNSCRRSQRHVSLR